MYLLAYLELFQGNEGKCSWSAKFLFDRQKVVIADHRDRERWERYFEPWTSDVSFHMSQLLPEESLLEMTKFCLYFSSSCMSLLQSAIIFPFQLMIKSHGIFPRIYSKSISHILKILNYYKFKAHTYWVKHTYFVSASDLCIISIISTICKSIPWSAWRMASTASTMAYSCK